MLALLVRDVTEKEENREIIKKIGDINEIHYVLKEDIYYYQDYIK